MPSAALLNRVSCRSATESLASAVSRTARLTNSRQIDHAVHVGLPTCSERLAVELAVPYRATPGNLNCNHKLFAPTLRSHYVVVPNLPSFSLCNFAVCKHIALHCRVYSAHRCFTHIAYASAAMNTIVFASCASAFYVRLMRSSPFRWPAEFWGRSRTLLVSSVSPDGSLDDSMSGSTNGSTNSSSGEWLEW